MMKNWMKHKTIGWLILLVFALMTVPAWPAGAATTGKLTKNETVYAKLSAQGQVTDTTVVNWLHFDGAHPASLTDPVKLSGLKALNGSFQVQAANGGVRLTSLAGKEQDFFYSGRSAKGLPVKVTIQYYLNNKAINPRQLVGKNGPVKLVVKVSNQLASNASLVYQDAATGQAARSSKRIWTPLMTMISLELPIDKFSRVEAPDGVVTVVGKTMKVNWMLFPYPDSSVTLTMQARDFELNSMSLVVQPKMPPVAEVGDLDSKLNELNNGLTKMDQSLSQAQDGAQKLDEGQSAIRGALQQLSDGLDQLALLNQAQVQLINGAITINDKLLEAITPLANNAMLKAKVTPVVEALNQQKTVLGLLLKGGQVEQQTLPPFTTTADKLGEAKEGLYFLDGGLEQSEQGAAQLTGGMQKLRDSGVKVMRTGLNQSINQVRVQLAEKAAVEKKVTGYDSFMGKPAGSKARVQFILQTEELKAP